MKGVVESTVQKIVEDVVRQTSLSYYRHEDKTAQQTRSQAITKQRALQRAAKAVCTKVITETNTRGLSNSYFT